MPVKNPSPEYIIWKNMWQRCTNPNHPAYKNYGGRGIGIDKTWRSFASFFADVGQRPSKEHSLGRVDNEQGYSKENCRWETALQQANNRRPHKSWDGVGYDSKNKKWRARLAWMGKSYFIGNFPTEEAAKAAHYRFVNKIALGRLPE